MPNILEKRSFCAEIPPDDLLKDATNAYPLSDAKLRVCRYDDGGGGSALAGAGLFSTHQWGLFVGTSISTRSKDATRGS